MSGSVTRRKISSRPAPSVAAASSNRVSMPRRAPSTVITRNGIATNASATTTPGVVNGSVMPNHASRYWPTMPATTEGEQQRDAAHHGWQHERHGHQRAGEAAAGELGARQHPGQRYADHEARPRSPRSR